MRNRLAASLALDAPVTSVAGVSEGRAAAFVRMGIHSVGDLVHRWPRRYMDLTNVATIADAPIGQNVTIAATVHAVTLKRPRPKFSLVEVTLVDGTGTLMVTFFRQPWLMKTLTAGMRVSVAGVMEFNYGYKRMTMPLMDKLDDGAAAQGRIIPVHPASEKLPAGQMRRFMEAALEAVDGVYDPLPLSLRSKYRLMSYSEALRSMHFPATMAQREQARRRLAYEEALCLQIGLLQEARKAEGDGEPVAHVVDGRAFAALQAALPFELTEGQKSAIASIASSMAEPARMHHMLLGDVGTGKTAVAAHALAIAADTGSQALMMGPTEVLVDQYASALGPLLDAAGVRWAELTGSTPAAQREAIIAGLASGELSVVFGTQALLEDDVAPACCSLVVIDEEQRFGVNQREALLHKGPAPDALFMTATPIPRSMALALYGAMGISYLTEAPFTRPPRTTKVYDFRQRGKAYDVALEACNRGEQVYIVCPLVGEKKPAEDSKDATPARERTKFGFSGGEHADELDIYIDTDADMPADDSNAAQEKAKFLQAKTFSAYRVGLLHGKMKAAEKREVMDAFRDGDIDVLVSTTVIEVGVDVPNATVMIVEDADRFGLSQLHQLRGRVGRGEKPGFMCLVSSTSSKDAAERLAAMERTENGFELAEYDLSLRREGDVLGNKQHGASMLMLVNVVRDAALVEAAHADAVAYVAEHGQGDDCESALLFRRVDAMIRSADAATKTQTQSSKKRKG